MSDDEKPEDRPEPTKKAAADSKPSPPSKPAPVAFKTESIELDDSPPRED